ncbi:hypothetical protein HI914_04671 [Erysiphe necator]|nr:hypothetical protein HI914_04671 [Erysiphe necator]
MIGTSKFEYFYIRFFIVILHLIAPLCLAYCLSLLLFYGPIKLVSSPFSLYAFAESLFLVAYFPYRSYLQRDATDIPTTDPQKRKELFDRCRNNIPDPELYIRTWFLGAELAEIKRDNLKDFILWAFFNREGPPGEDDDELNAYIEQMESKLGRKFEEGRGNAVSIRLTFDKVKMLHRSIFWYLCVGFVDSLTHIIMHYHGFDFYREDHGRFLSTFPFRPLTLLSSLKSPVKKTAYWYRKHKSNDLLPVVFLHGIGIGLYPYTPFLKELNQLKKVGFSRTDEQIGIIAIENLNISFRLRDAPANSKVTCSEIEQIILNHFPPNQQFVFVAHSFGTNVVSLLLKNPATAKYINSIVLIDPIPILLHLPTVAYNFTRKTPSKANEHQLFYFATMDMGIARTLGRHFHWSEVILWKEDLGNRNTTVSLCGQDLIVDTESVGRYLSTSYAGEYIIPGLDENYAHPEEKKFPNNTFKTPMDNDVRKVGTKENLYLEPLNDEWKFRSWIGTGIDILWFGNLDHAQIFDKYSTRRSLLNVIRTYCRDGCSIR